METITEKTKEPKYKEFLGRKIGMLTVLAGPFSRKTAKSTHYYFECRCDCGKNKLVRNCQIYSNSIKSCGCKTRELISTMGGASRERLYFIWRNMLSRIDNPRNKRYKLYGEKGIKIYEGWRNYQNFKEWAINNGYMETEMNNKNRKNQLSIHRKDSNKDYCPENCIWITVSENSTIANNERKYRETQSKQKNKELLKQNQTLQNKLDLLNTIFNLYRKGVLNEA